MPICLRRWVRKPVLRIMRLLLSAHPEGMIVGDIQTELGIPNSTLSHHLEKLRTEGLVKVRRTRAISLVYGGYGCTCRKYCLSCMRNAARGIRPSSPRAIVEVCAKH